MKMKLIKCCIWSVAVYGSETWTLGKNEDRVVNAFKAWSCRRMLKIKWQIKLRLLKFFKGEKRKIIFKILKNRRH
jgi:hypothetical protein